MGGEFSFTKYDTLEESLTKNKIERVDLSDYQKYTFSKNQTKRKIPLYLEDIVARWYNQQITISNLRHDHANPDGPIPKVTMTNQYMYPLLNSKDQTPTKPKPDHVLFIKDSEHHYFNPLGSCEDKSIYCVVDFALSEDSPHMLILSIQKKIYNINLLTGKIMSYNESIDQHLIQKVVLNKDDIILEGTTYYNTFQQCEQTSDNMIKALGTLYQPSKTHKLLNLNSEKQHIVAIEKVQKADFSFLNWACRPCYTIIIDEFKNNNNRIYKAGGKLGYETMCYSGNTQYNNFFSKRTKKLILRTYHTDTYDIQGKFGKYKQVPFEELIKTIKWYDQNNLRFDLVLSSDCLFLANTLQKYTVKMVPISKVIEKLPFLKYVQLRNFIVLTKKSVLLMVNDSTQEIITISLKAKSFSEIKYHKFNFSYRIEREMSKEHNALVLWVKQAQSYFLYVIDKDFRLKLVHISDNLKFSGLVNRGDTIAYVKPIFEDVEMIVPQYAEDLVPGTVRWFCGVELTTIDVNVDL